MGVAGSYSPDGTRLAINRKAQAYWRKYYRGAYQSDVTVMDLASKTFKDVTSFDGMDSWPIWGRDGFIYFVSDREGQGPDQHLAGARDRRRGRAGHPVHRAATSASPAISGDGKTIVFEHDFGIWKLDVASREVKPIPLEIAAETQETLTEFREFNSTVDDYDLAPDGKRIVLSVHGEVFSVPTDEEGRPPPAHRGRGPRSRTCNTPRTASRSPSSPTRAAARRSTSSPPTARARPESSPTSIPEVVDRLVARQQVDRLHDIRPQALHDRRRRQGPQGAGVLQLRPDRRAGVVAGRQADRLLQGRRLPGRPTST